MAAQDYACPVAPLEPVPHKRRFEVVADLKEARNRNLLNGRQRRIQRQPHRHLWRVAIAGGQPERVDTVGADVLSPALSPQGRRLTYTQTVDDINIWRIELDAAGKTKSQAELIASTFGDHGPDYSPDGGKIVFTSGRSATTPSGSVKATGPNRVCCIPAGLM